MTLDISNISNKTSFLNRDGFKNHVLGEIFPVLTCHENFLMRKEVNYVLTHFKISIFSDIAKTGNRRELTNHGVGQSDRSKLEKPKGKENGKVMP